MVDWSLKKHLKNAYTSINKINTCIHTPAHMITWTKTHNHNHCFLVTSPARQTLNSLIRLRWITNKGLLWLISHDVGEKILRTPNNISRTTDEVCFSWYVGNCFSFRPSSHGISRAIWNEYSEVENWIVEAVLQVWADRCSEGAHTEKSSLRLSLQHKRGEVPH